MNSHAGDFHKLCADIRRLHALGEALNISAVREKYPKLLQLAYRIKPFLGWKRALQAAGLEYGKIRIRLPTRVACKICGVKRRMLVEHVQFHHKMSPGKYLERFPGAAWVSEASLVKRLGSLTSGRFKSKRIIAHWEPVWSPEYVLDRMFELHKQGVQLVPSVMERWEGLLYRWALTYFEKNWDMALRAIGLNPSVERMRRRRRYWTRWGVIQALRQRKAAGQTLNFSALAESDRSLLGGALKLFRTYDRALAAAGVNPAQIRRRPVPANKYRTRDDVISAILRRKALTDLPLNSDGICEGPARDLSLYNKARRLFGSWRMAIEAAGLNYDKICLNFSPYQNPDSVLKEITRRHANGFSVVAENVRKGEGKDLILYSRALKYFGSWLAATKAAGIPGEIVRPSRSKYPTKDAVLREIQRRVRAGLPLDATAMRFSADPDLALFMRARRLFGTWPDAVQAAGHRVTRRPMQSRYPSAEAVIACIKRRSETSLPLNYKALIHKGAHADTALYNIARRHFKTWRHAIEAAGLKYDSVARTVLEYPSRAAVLEEIRRRQTVGWPINFAGVRSGAYANEKLFTRGIYLFGSWRAAVEATGFDYKAIRWSRKIRETGAVRK